MNIKTLEQKSKELNDLYTQYQKDLLKKEREITEGLDVGSDYLAFTYSHYALPHIAIVRRGAVRGGGATFIIENGEVKLRDVTDCPERQVNGFKTKITEWLEN